MPQQESSIKLTFAILVTLTLIAIPTPATAVSQQVTVTISGTITSLSGPVSGVWIGIGSSLDWGETLTNGSGFYSITIQTDGAVWFHIRPDISTGLSQINLYKDGVSGDFTQDFTLEDGYLMRLQPLGDDGLPLTGDIQIDIESLINRLPENQWHNLDKDDLTGEYQAVLPPDIYYVTARNLPGGYYPTTKPFDLRTGDISTTLQINTTYIHPIPIEPPDATKIVVSPPDDLGEAEINGTPGSALPLAQILLVNLNSTHQAQAISADDGSFSTQIFAPPGSSIMIKHGPASYRWADLDVGISEGVNPFPGTIIQVPYTHATESYQLPFASAGAIDYWVDDPNTTLNYVGSAWSITGTLGPVVVAGEWTRVLTGTYGNQVIPGLYLGGFNWTRPALGDLDGDADQDLLVGHQWGTLVLYRNQGSSSSPDWVFEDSNFAGIYSEWWLYPTLKDVTGDSNPDLFVGTGEGAVDIYYWSEGTIPQTPDLTLTAGNQAAPALGDIDGDGDEDLLVGHSGGTLYLYRNLGTTSVPNWSFETDTFAGISETGGWMQPAFLDLDGDTDTDLLIGLCGSLVWYERGGTNPNPAWTRQTSDPIGYGGGSCGTSFAVGNWNNDIYTDLITGEHWGNLRFFRGDGSASWIEDQYPFPFDLAGDSAPALADWDNDGDLDMLVGMAHGAIHQFTNIGDSSTPDWSDDGVLISLPWTNHPHPFPFLADIDGDDDYDLFVGEGDWNGPESGGNIRFYSNDGDPSSPVWNLVTTDYLSFDVGGWSSPAFVDIDADNDLDLFIGDSSGTLTFVENTGMVTEAAWAVPIQPYLEIDVGENSAPAFFDLDQDNDLDMLVGSQNGSLATIRNTGTITNPAWELVAMTHPDVDIGENSRPVAADLNGDLLSDLVLGDGDGGINLYLYAGPGSPPTSGDIYFPNDIIQVEGILKLYSPAITGTIDLEGISVNGGVDLLKLHDDGGNPFAADNYLMSTMLTPTGFPIQNAVRSSIGIEGNFNSGDFQYSPDYGVEGRFTLSFQLPDGLSAGIYRPQVHLGFTGVPTSTSWLAANVTHYTYDAQSAMLPPIQVGGIESPRLIWELLMDDFVQGTHGTSARDEQKIFSLASQIVSQGASYYAPPVDLQTNQTITYRLEPFLPMISYTDRRIPGPPLIPFQLPGGNLCVTVLEPDKNLVDLGCDIFSQSLNRTKTTRDGLDLNTGTVQIDDVYSLKTATDRFVYAFDQYGHHVITMTGFVDDIWGRTYSGGGTYDIWMAQPMDIDPGVLPGTPLAVGDTFNPAVSFSPKVPAVITITLTHYPHSDPDLVEVYTVDGQANNFGYFGSDNSPITLSQPGEYRVDITAKFIADDGTLYMGALTWGGIVMTPDPQAQLVAHGRRGLDSLTNIPNHWFVSCRDLPIQAGAISHTLNPYFNGDIVWSTLDEPPGVCPSGIASGGDSLILGSSLQDTIGVIEAAVQARVNRRQPPISTPGDINERFNKGEIPLFSSTISGQPPHFLLRIIGDSIPEDVDQIGYSYRSSQRPGVRVREVVAEDGQSGGYWRLNTLYDDQLGVGILGDQPNDFKFQYVGAVYRDLQSGHSEYIGQGSGWVFIPPDDTTGSRVMPPFSGLGNGGWTTEGGPILTLLGEEIHIFLLPTGTRPGSILEVGDTFHFTGHIMPTLDSQVAYTVTTPGGTQFFGGGQANSIGYFYDPEEDFVVNEPGMWSVDVRVWHDGQCSGGATIPPYPSGDVLGSDTGRYWFYVVPENQIPLQLTSPTLGFYYFENEVSPIIITGTLPSTFESVLVDYTISMPGYVLEHGQFLPTGKTYQVIFDPVALNEDFPNVDLIGRDGYQAGLADTFTISLMLKGQVNGEVVYGANTVTLQGQQVYMGDWSGDITNDIFLPIILFGN